MGDADAAAEVPAAEVPTVADGERLDRYVALVSGCSRSRASDAVRRGEVMLDGEPARRPSQRLAAGQVVEIHLAAGPTARTPVAESEVTFGVLHEDDSVVIVEKPPGLVVHPAPGHATGTLCNGLLARYPEIADVGEVTRPGIVHRLDRMTSGLLVVARDAHSYDALRAQLAVHGVDRVYSAVVIGRPDARLGVVDAPIGRSRRNPLRMTVAAGAKDSRTHFEVIETFDSPSCALVKCRLETGRTHQIRVHMASIGHPVAGDDLYGGVREGFDLPRMFLHAEELGFVHPRTDQWVRFESPVPPDLTGWLDGRRRRAT